jgi:cytochrome bd-type quinol oxidase subunit 2
MGKLYTILLCILVNLSLYFIGFYTNCILQGYTLNVVYNKSGITQHQFDYTFTILNLIISLSGFIVSISVFLMHKEKTENDKELTRVINHLKSELKKRN